MNKGAKNALYITGSILTVVGIFGSLQIALESIQKPVFVQALFFGYIIMFISIACVGGILLFLAFVMPYILEKRELSRRYNPSHSYLPSRSDSSEDSQTDSSRFVRSTTFTHPEAIHLESKIIDLQRKLRLYEKLYESSHNRAYMRKKTQIEQKIKLFQAKLDGLKLTLGADI